MTSSKERPPLTSETSASASPPAAFGRYRVVHQVGAGALGPVFRCYDPETDRTVAVKAFPLDITPEQAADLADALGHLATLNLAHPSIIAPLAAGADGSTAFLVQDYFIAESVDVALRQYGPAPIPDALRLVGQLAGAIDFAAVTGVRHGSVHPRDILVAPHEVRLTGLGVAQAVEQIGFRVAPRLPYSAPERVEGALPWTTAADVFALAAVAYELLTGKRPFIGAEPFAADAAVSAAADPAALAESFARAFSPRPEDRFPTALSFAAALRHALTGEPLEPPAASAPHPHAARRRERGSRPGRLPLDAAAAAAASELQQAAPAENQAAAVPEAVAPGDEPPASAADELLAATEREDIDLPLAAAPVEAESEGPPPSADAERFAEIEAVAPAAPEPEPETRERFADWEPPVEVEPPPGDMYAAPPEPQVEEGGVREAEQAATADPWGVEGPSAMEPAPLPLEAEPLPDAAAIPRPSFDAAPPSDAGVAPPSVAPGSGAGDAPPSERERGVRRAEDIRIAPREEVRMPPPPPPAATRPDRPFTPPPGGRGTASFGRPKLPLSWLLAMLLLGILGGFVGGYLLGSGESSPSIPAEPSPASEAPANADPQGSAPSPVSEPPAPGEGTAPPSEGSAPARPEGAGASPRGAATTPPAPEQPAERVSPTPAPARPANPPAARPTRPRETATPPSRATTATPGARFEGGLVVISRPPGAVVRLDGRAVGKTPLTLKAIGAGSHVVRIELDGYRPWTAAIQVVAGRQNRVTASLEQRPGGS